MPLVVAISIYLNASVVCDLHLAYERSRDCQFPNASCVRKYKGLVGIHSNAETDNYFPDTVACTRGASVLLLLFNNYRCALSCDTTVR